MGTFLRYFRAHPWQRRVLTISTTMVVAAIVGFIAFPHIRDYQLLRELASGDPEVRNKAIGWGVSWAKENGSTVGALERAMNSAGDDQFRAIVSILRYLNKFDTPQRDPNQVDRLRLIDFNATRSSDEGESLINSRRLILQQVIRSGRDGAYVRRFLAAAVSDPAPAVREAACILAARLRDANALGMLMADANAGVQAAAAMDAGLAGMKELQPKLLELLDSTDVPDVVSSCVDAIIRLDGNAAVQAIINEAFSFRIAVEPGMAGKPGGLDAWNIWAESRQFAASERVFYVFPQLPSGDAAALLDTQLRVDANSFPPPWPSGRMIPSAATLLAGGRMKLPQAAPAAMRVLNDTVAGKGEITEAQLVAALDAADRLNLPVRRQTEAIIRTLWHPAWSLTMMKAVEVLEHQIDRPQPADANAPSRDECLRTLRLAATFQALPQTQPASSPAAGMVTTPLPSAAAAVSLWRLAPAASYIQRDATGLRVDVQSPAFYIHTAASVEPTGPADYIAWQLAESNNPLAFELGLSLLPPAVEPNVPLGRQPPRVYSPNARAAGAMLLGLAARTPAQRTAAIERLRNRLTGGTLGNLPDAYDASTYRCALLCLGEKDALPEVRKLLLPDFPFRRALTALCAAGDGAGLDWLLGDLQDRPEDTLFFLINLGCGEVIAKAAPQLPAVDPLAPPDIRLWQAKRMQHYYAIHREKIQFAPLH